MKRYFSAVGAALAASTLLKTVPADSAFALPLPLGAAASGQDIHQFHMLLLWACAVIAAGVYTAMITALIKFRRSTGVEPAKFPQSMTAEIVWTAIPALILIAMAVPAAGTLMRLGDAGDVRLTIKVTGHQQRWEYEYVDQAVVVVSRPAHGGSSARPIASRPTASEAASGRVDVDERVVIPVDSSVRLLITSADQRHSWSLPELGISVDAVPGIVAEAGLEATRIGRFRGQCDPPCVSGDGSMPIVVDVVSADDFSDWLSSKRAALVPAAD